jgi:MFS family permease
MSGAATVAAGQEHRPEGIRRTVWGAFWSLLIDMYDIYLPVVALAPAIVYFEPKNLPASTTATLFYLVFAATLVGRPLGAFIFGHLGDRWGRKVTTMIAISGFGIATLLIALLPGYQQWGLAAMYVLTLLRFIDGIFLGGQYTAAIPLAMEYAPKAKRGLYGGAIQSAFPLAYVLISLFTSLVFVFSPPGTASAPYVQWGWRIPFLVGALGSAIVVWFYSRSVPESELWRQSPKTRSPLRELFSGESFRNLAQVFILQSGAWFLVNSVISTLPAVLITVLKLPSVTVTHELLVAYVVLAAGFVTAGAVSQIVGRRRLYAIMGLLSAVVAPVLYYLIVAAPKVGFGAQTVLASVLLLITIGMWGMVVSYISERFRTSVRSAGYGIGYSLAVIIPSFYSFYMLGLAHFMPYAYTQIVLVVIGGILVLVGALMGPETKDIDFVAD